MLDEENHFLMTDELKYSSDFHSRYHINFTVKKNFLIFVIFGRKIFVLKQES